MLVCYFLQPFFYHMQFVIWKLCAVNKGVLALGSREPRGFAFVQFVDSHDAAEAQYHMNGQIFAGREISVVVAAETRKRPEEMRRRTGPR